MTQSQTEPYRQELLSLKKRLGGDLSAVEKEALRGTGGEASGNLSNVPVHPADLGTDNFEEAVSVGLLENELQILEEINAALDRIEQGTYGVCEECHQEISPKRLKVLPYARLCLRDAQKLQDQGAD